MKTTCPNCKADLVGEPIPEEHQESYGGHTHFNRTIGIYDMDRDMTVEWMCPDCQHRWPRKESIVGGGYRTCDLKGSR